MRALRFHGAKDLRIDQIPEPKCADHQIKIKPAFVGICGTDLHEYSSPTFIPAVGHPHPVTGEVMPIGFGHEFSGTVTEIGSGVRNEQKLRVGDKVAVQPTICCFECPPCLQHFLNCCDKTGFVGLSGGGGGLSDYVCVDGKFVHKLPSDIDLAVGALVEPLAVAWHAVDTSGIKPGDNVLVLGAGPIGLGVIQCAKARGASQIIVAEAPGQRQTYATNFGATHLFDPYTEDVVAQAKRLCPAHGGPDIAFDCAGAPASLTTAVAAVKARGTILNVAIWEKPVSFDPNSLVFGEKLYRAVLGYQSADFQGVIAALGDGNLKPEQMITRRIAIDRIVEDGFQALLEEREKHVKILVDLARSA